MSSWLIINHLYFETMKEFCNWCFLLSSACALFIDISKILLTKFIYFNNWKVEWLMVQDICYALIPLAVHWSKRQRESWVGDKFVLSTKLISWQRWGSQQICIWLGAEVAMPRIDWVDVQRGDQKKSTNRRSSQRLRKDQSNCWSE